MKIKLKITLLFLLTAAAAYPQNLDSIYNFTVKTLKGFSSQTDAPKTLPVKCLFSEMLTLKNNFDKLDKKQKEDIAKLLERPPNQTSIVSPSGRFRIHYDTTGYSAPSYSVEEAAAAIDYVYDYETGYLGYPPAPSDQGAGGDDKYDIYISNLGNVYGMTITETALTPNTSTSFIQMDNDFLNFNTEGIDAAKVTLAHEYHHAIQVGNYQSYTNDQFYFEITSTAMEDFVYDDINDYIAYMKNYFRYPELSFSKTRGAGYDLAIWNIYLKQKFSSVSDTAGFYIIKRSWEMMRSRRALSAIAGALAEAGSSFQKELNEFGTWTYFTGFRAKQGEYFVDAVKYPAISPLVKYNYSPPEKSAALSVHPMANNFLVFIDESNGLSDTLVSIITDGDVSMGINDPDGETEVTYSLYSSAQSGYREIIKDRYYSLISGANADLFLENNIFNNEPAGSASGKVSEIDYVYPQPFKYSGMSVLSVPVAPNTLNEATLNIYTLNMQLVYSERKQINSASGKIILLWNGLDSHGEKLPSGVYFYVTDSQGTVKKGKFIIVND
ncbi:MAG: T9SS type A sorting domain-containing protein [Chlorobi bacterium]|nr:T9SS type A sorting domain-containing protein [Chlorobiota bacterium]